MAYRISEELKGAILERVLETTTTGSGCTGGESVSRRRCERRAQLEVANETEAGTPSQGQVT